MQTESPWRNNVLWLIDVLGAIVVTVSVCLLFVACAFSIPCSDDACQRSENGRILTQAIDRFRDRTGHYPKSLSELIPIELDNLPTEPEGTNYGYWLATDGYSVSYVWEFKSKDNAEIHISACTFRSNQQVWNCYID